MRNRPILGLTVLVCLVATLGVGLLACLAPVAAPATTATPAPTIAPYVPPPTPPMPTPRPGASPISSVTKTYAITFRSTSETLALKTGDLVVLTVAFEGGTAIGVDVDAPPLGVNAAPEDRVAMMGTGVDDGETRKLSFLAKFDGNYTLNVWQRNVAVTGGTATVKIDIFR